MEVDVNQWPDQICCLRPPGVDYHQPGEQTFFPAGDKGQIAEGGVLDFFNLLLGLEPGILPVPEDKVREVAIINIIRLSGRGDLFLRLFFFSEEVEDEDLALSCFMPESQGPDNPPASKG